MKVLVSDKISKSALEVFAAHRIDVDFNPGLGKDPAALKAAVADCDGLVIRSATKVTSDLLRSAPKLKVVGRAGIGIDNVDLASATRAGVVVMNTPHGNATTTAEHAIAMMFAVARQLPDADRSTKAGKWEKSRFMGTEITAKTLGIIGCGNIGAIVAERAKGLRMRVIAFDPMLTGEQALELGVERVDLATLFARSDFITLHTPLTDETRGIVDAAAIAAMKDGVRIINCARGGLVDETALLDGLVSGKVAGAALDVFETEPATDNPLFDAPNLVCTPHLGASTHEAQENVAIQVAEQMCGYLTSGAVTNAVNLPAVDADDASAMEPMTTLADQLGAIAGAFDITQPNAVQIEYAGGAAVLKTEILTRAVLAGFVRSHTPANLVNAMTVAEELGLSVDQVRSSGSEEGEIRLKVTAGNVSLTMAGTVLADGRPRVTKLAGMAIEATIGRHMLYLENRDEAGFIGRFGSLLGEAGINIAGMSLGRCNEAGRASALVEVDDPIDDEVLQRIAALEGVLAVHRLNDLAPSQASSHDTRDEVRLVDDRIAA